MSKLLELMDLHVNSLPIILLLVGRETFHLFVAKPHEGAYTLLCVHFCQKGWEVDAS
jgi:hypothetical protein